jgi:hypothetical protein
MLGLIARAIRGHADRLPTLNASDRLADDIHLNDTGIAAAAMLEFNAMNASGAPLYLNGAVNQNTATGGLLQTIRTNDARMSIKGRKKVRRSDLKNRAALA